jgi:hypothetical protein
VIFFVSRLVVILCDVDRVSPSAQHFGRHFPGSMELIVLLVIAMQATRAFFLQIRPETSKPSPLAQASKATKAAVGGKDRVSY